MTDKEMIINGVDVSECEHSFEQFDNWVGKDVVMCDCTLGCRCEPKENHCKFYMYYLEQQLKRKEKECEELRKQLERKEENYQKLLNKSNKYIHNLVDENVQDISKLARQLDQLKTELEQEKALKETYLTCYKAKHEDINGELFKLKQTLTEIREVAKQMNNECFYDDFECKDCDMKNGCTYFNKSKILQIIKEMK